ncbi:unnamed protein product, partial [Heligmosomoides polygyrus]|uniref:Ribosomal RNA-processing protein 8 n=1 Tax=Heligmosomoides polygyrus TaxID=6339 RepID=A0A183GB56_HELPZ
KVQLPTEESSVKKKKKRKRKKKYVEGAEEPEKEPAAKATPTQQGLEKLEAGRFRFLNEQLYTMTGSEAWEYFQGDPDAFKCYHNGFAEQVKKWPNHPLASIIKWLKSKPAGSVVLDMGCGEAKLAASLSDVHKVHSFDLVAVNDFVTACDMAHLPIEASSADIVVFCLSLMGTNLSDYIKETRRVLKIGGILKVAEVVSRFVNVKLFCTALCKLGFEQTEKVVLYSLALISHLFCFILEKPYSILFIPFQKQLNDYFIMLEFKKIEKVENKRPFGLKLKPCLYKKR